MTKILLSLCLFSIQLSLLAAAPTKNLDQETTTPQKQISLVFGAKGLNVGVNTLDFIMAINKELQQSSPLIQKKARQYAAHVLRHDVHGKRFKNEITYLKAGATNPSTTFSYNDKTLGSAIVHYVKEVHRKIKSATTKQVEQFLKQLQRNPLPEPLNVWNSSNVSYHNKSEARTQNMLVDMAIMMGSQFAVEAANQWVDSQDSILWTVLSQASSNIQSDFSTFQNDIKSFVQEALTSAINIFSAALSTIHNAKSQAQLNSQAEIEYLSKMTSLDLPKGEYLVSTTTMSGATYDALFEQSKMFTPSGAVWRNFNPKGDWGFDPTTKSFWQYSLVDTVTTEPVSTSSNNYIFTEFFTNQASYEVDCDITLYKVSYPFFSAILFNNNRWISGSMSGFRRYRAVGIYGKSADEIGVYYVEQTDPKVAPLDIILSGEAQKLGDVTSGDGIASDDGLTYSFNITNASENITIKFGESGETMTSASITSKDPTMFIYHGVGFISPGAIAQYKLKQPSALLFSDDAITDFQKEMSALSTMQTTATT